MSSGLPASLGAELLDAFAQKGYVALTPVQTAVLDPALDGRDLRITSQTGSGKTVALGLTLRNLLKLDAGKSAGPRALVVTPTRELAKQVEEELTWLYAPQSARVVSVTGGSSYRDERRALGGGAGVVVGTPGRLLDHLQRKSFDASFIAVVVLDEADRLLDLGFRDDLEAILAFAPDGHRTHLVSATFPRDVQALADATQTDPVHVEGTRLGAANADIDHVVHLVDPRQRVDALVNILLANPDEQTLIFARTRADVAAIAQDLRAAGFPVSSLSGEMEQNARNRALAAFKSGELRALVATDVAARGIDVQDIARVVHAEPPNDADSYTHRSGRTGRAGRKGTSVVLAMPAQLARTTFLLQRAGVPYRFEPIPTAEAIRRSAEERAVNVLTGDDPTEATGIDERTWAIAKRVAEGGNPTRSIARLLLRARYAGPTAPRDLRVIEPPVGRGRRASEGRGERGAVRKGDGGRGLSHVSNQSDAHRHVSNQSDAPRHVPSQSDAPRHVPSQSDAPRHVSNQSEAPRRGSSRAHESSWVPFRVTWGQKQGADVRRLLALVCRRGGIRGSDVGSIRVGDTHSVVDVSTQVADAFASAASAPDPRDPRVVIRSEQSEQLGDADGGSRSRHAAASPEAASARARPSESGRKHAPDARTAPSQKRSRVTAAEPGTHRAPPRVRRRPQGEAPLKRRSRGD